MTERWCGAEKPHRMHPWEGLRVNFEDKSIHTKRHVCGGVGAPALADKLRHPDNQKGDEVTRRLMNRAALMLLATSRQESYEWAVGVTFDTDEVMSAPMAEEQAKKILRNNQEDGSYPDGIRLYRRLKPSEWEEVDE